MSKFLNHPYAGRGKSILVYCSWCKREHRMTPQDCTSCSGRSGIPVLMPSDWVYERCRATYECEGCEAYRGRY